MADLTREQFIEQLIEAGWSRKEAEAEWEWNMGPDGDVDGDLDAYDGA